MVEKYSVERSVYDDYDEEEDDDYVVPSAPKKSRWMAESYEPHRRSGD